MSPKDKNLKFGCFIQGKQAQLPLKRVTHTICITNSVAYVDVFQTFLNDTQQNIEIQYNFPISSNRCLVSFSAALGEKNLRGIIKPIKQALLQYEQAVEDGKKTVFAQISEDRSHAMILKIGNVEPKQKVDIFIAYVEELSITQNTFYQFYLPIIFNERQSKGLTNNIQGQRVTGQFDWKLELKIKNTPKIIKYFSETHKLKLLTPSFEQKQLLFGIQESQSNISERFNFLFTVQNFQVPTYILGQTDLGSSLMVSFIPKFCKLSVEDAQAAHLKQKRLQINLDSVKGEYIFLLDRSGSMEGEKIDGAKKSLNSFIKNLPKDSFFNVVSFGSNHQQLFKQSKQNSKTNVESAMQSIQNMAADLGGTQILNPLRNLLNKQIIQGYPRHIFLLTDGQVDNTNEIIDLVRRNIKYSRVHTIGVGEGVSKQLIKQCARAGKGNHTFIETSQGLQKKVIQMLEDSLSPLISQIQLKYDQDIVDSIIPNPQSIPYILKGEIINFFIFFKGKITKPTNISFSYVDTLNKLPYSSQVIIDQNTKTVEFIDKLATFKKIKALQLAQVVNSSQTNKLSAENQLYSLLRFDLKSKIVDLSLSYQILSKYTAVICIQNDISDEAIPILAKIPRQKIIIQPKQPCRRSGKAKTSSSKYYGKIGHCKLLACSQSSRAGLTFPVPRIKRYLKRQLSCMRVSRSTPVYMTAVLEYLTAEITQLSGNACKDSKCSRITPKHIKLSINKDEELKRMCLGRIIQGVFVGNKPVEYPKSPKKDYKKWVQRLKQQQKAEGYWNNSQLLQEIVLPQFFQDFCDLTQDLITLMIVNWLRLQSKEKGLKRTLRKAIGWLNHQNVKLFKYEKYLK